MEEGSQPQGNEKHHRLVLEALATEARLPEFRIPVFATNSPVTFDKLLTLSGPWHPHLSNGENLTSQGCENCSS